jgi:hypothetical protein
MWAQKFGNRGKAIALRTSPELLTAAAKRFLGADGPCYLGEIRYVDHSVDDVSEANMLEVAFVVQNRFEYLNEVRFYLHILSSSVYAVLTTEYLGRNDGRPDLRIGPSPVRCSKDAVSASPKVSGTQPNGVRCPFASATVHR